VRSVTFESVAQVREYNVTLGPSGRTAAPEAVEVCEPEGDLTAALKTLLSPCRNEDDTDDDND
jgi:hypothetical protein